jgi:transcriptional regulator with XRE-family HTH domain
MVGERIREARTARQLSLSDVAVKASVSTATLSRIETGKQAIEVALLLNLAKILRTTASDLLGPDGNGEDDNVAERIAALGPADRLRFWQDMSGSRQKTPGRGKIEDVANEVEELLAQIDFLRGEVERIRVSLRGRQARRSSR